MPLARHALRAASRTRPKCRRLLLPPLLLATALTHPRRLAASATPAASRPYVTKRQRRAAAPRARSSFPRTAWRSGAGCKSGQLTRWAERAAATAMGDDLHQNPSSRDRNGPNLPRMTANCHACGLPNKLRARRSCLRLLPTQGEGISSPDAGSKRWAPSPLATTASVAAGAWS